MDLNAISNKANVHENILIHVIQDLIIYQFLERRYIVVYYRNTMHFVDSSLEDI